MLFYNTGNQKVSITRSAAVASVLFWDYNNNTFNALSGSFDDATYPGECIVTLAAADTNRGVGPVIVIALDAGGNGVGHHNDYIMAGPQEINNAADVRAAVGLAAANLDGLLNAIGAAVASSAIRSAVGLASANLDTQFNAIPDAADIRAAIGLASANLDTQLAAIGTFSASAIRAAIGLASANLDTQLAAIGSGLDAAGVRAAIGLATANLDAQLAAILADVLPAAIRAAIGLASANLQDLIAGIPPPPPPPVRAIPQHGTLS